MKVSILDMNKLITVNKLQQITTGNLMSNKMMYDPGGILSNEIFGISKSDRRSTYAYIDLGRHYIHPHIYENVLKRMMRTKLSNILTGQQRYSVVNGQLEKDPENGWTGIDELYKHWNEIDWANHTSSNEANKKLLSSLGRDEIFINKEIVNPPAYRDVILSGTYDASEHVNEVNKLYVQLIRLVAMLSEGGRFAAMQYATQNKIQETLGEIYKYFKKLISKKTGLIRKSLLGKSTDYGVRSVISAPSYDNETFEDNMIDMEHVALPLSMSVSAFYPFIESWLRNFFTREIINDPNLVTYYNYQTKKEITATIKDPDIQFSEKNIKKMINDYILNPDNRFRVMNIDLVVPNAKSDEDKTIKCAMILKGKKILPNNIQETLNRAMTITDILYLAAVEVCEKRHVMISRYPVGTDKHIFFSKVRVQSTAKHIKLIFNGNEYPYYPDIDLNTPHDKIGVQFIDTLVMSNSHLAGAGADYDGDTLSIRGIWTDEANLEAEEIMRSKISALSISGTNIKTVSKELFNSLFELTKEGPNPKTLSNLDTEEVLALTPSNITRSLLTKYFADTVNASEKNVAGKHKPRFQTWDKLTIPKDYFYEGQKEFTTTIGRFIFDKFVLEGSGCITLIGNTMGILNGNEISNLDNNIARIYMEDKIDNAKFNNYIDRRDCIGYWLNGMLAHTISQRMLKPLPEIEKRKAELCEKYKDEIAAGNIDIMTKISKELVEYAKELLKDDPGMDLYTSGDLNFGNNYKQNMILKGAVLNEITNEFDFIDTALMDGIKIKDVPAHANSILAAQYPGSIATADAGYLGKKILSVLQMMEVNEDPESDCGTKNLIPISINKDNSSNMLYSYIDDGGSLTLLTQDNINKYVGKTVMMRSPMSCTDDKICAKCAGKLFSMLEVKHAGLFAVQISDADLNLGLKAKHNTVIDLHLFDPNDLIRPI